MASKYGSLRLLSTAVQAALWSLHRSHLLPNRSNFVCSILLMFLRVSRLFVTWLLPNFRDFLQNITFCSLLISLIFNQKILLLLKDPGTIVCHRTCQNFVIFCKKQKISPSYRCWFSIKNFAVFPRIWKWLFATELAIFLRISADNLEKSGEYLFRSADKRA